MSEMELILQELKSLRKEMNNRFDELEEQIEEVRHDGKITRVATNRIGEMLEAHLMIENA